ncbi:MAG: polysaccharide biosynthesis/export family protein [Ferruginibacter sp.]
MSENEPNFLAINLMMKESFSCLRLLKANYLLSILFFGILVLFISSCKVTKPSSYFTSLKKDTTLIGFVTGDFQLKIRKGDRLSINVSSLSTIEDALFNSAGASVSATTSGTTGGGFTVQEDGTVLLHRLGAVKVAGLTRKELSTNLQAKLLAYMNEPIVQVNFLNHKVTILGEVSNPQVLPMPEEQLSVIDALVLSGDVTANAKRNNITIIREEGTEKKVKHINLEDNSIFSSPWYYVQPNDIILVSADTEKFVKEENRRKIQTNFSLLISGVSFLIIILDRVFK